MWWHRTAVGGRRPFISFFPPSAGSTPPSPPFMEPLAFLVCFGHGRIKMLDGVRGIGALRRAPAKLAAFRCVSPSFARVFAFPVWLIPPSLALCVFSSPLFLRVLVVLLISPLFFFFPFCRRPRFFLSLPAHPTPARRSPLPVMRRLIHAVHPTTLASRPTPQHSAPCASSPCPLRGFVLLPQSRGASR